MRRWGQGSGQQVRPSKTTEESRQPRAPTWGDIMALRLPLLHFAPLNSYWVGLTAAARARPALGSEAGPHPGATRIVLSSLQLYALLFGGAPPQASVHHPGHKAGGHLAQSYRGCSIPLAPHICEVPAPDPWWKHGWADLSPTLLALNWARYMTATDPIA